jgi:ribosomal protein L29
MLNPKELKQKTSDELVKMTADLRAELRDLRFKIATRQHTKVRVLRNTKRDIARVLTAIKNAGTTSSRA